MTVTHTEGYHGHLWPSEVYLGYSLLYGQDLCHIPVYLSVCVQTNVCYISEHLMSHFTNTANLCNVSVVVCFSWSGVPGSRSTVLLSALQTPEARRTLNRWWAASCECTPTSPNKHSVQNNRTMFYKEIEGLHVLVEQGTCPCLSSPRLLLHLAEKCAQSKTYICTNCENRYCLSDCGYGPLLCCGSESWRGLMKVLCAYIRVSNYAALKL